VPLPIEIHMMNPRPVTTDPARMPTRCVRLLRMTKQTVTESLGAGCRSWHTSHTTCVCRQSQRRNENTDHPRLPPARDPKARFRVRGWIARFLCSASTPAPSERQAQGTEQPCSDEARAGHRDLCPASGRVRQRCSVSASTSTGSPSEALRMADAQLVRWPKARLYS